MIPQILFIITLVLCVLGILGSEGWKRSEALGGLILIAWWFILLAFGGFFSVWHWPQYLVLAINLIAIAAMIIRDGELRLIDEGHIISALLWLVFEVGVIWWGGFFTTMKSSHSAPSDTIGESERIMIPKAEYVTIIKTPTSTTYIVNTPPVEK